MGGKVLTCSFFFFNQLKYLLEYVIPKRYNGRMIANIVLGTKLISKHNMNLSLLSIYQLYQQQVYQSLEYISDIITLKGKFALLGLLINQIMFNEGGTK